MSLHKIFFSSLMLGTLIFGAERAFAVKLNEVIQGQGISDDWEVKEKRSSFLMRDFWEVTNFPEAPSKHYSVPRTETPFDCAILSPWTPPAKLGGILKDKWTPEGISSHFFMTQEDDPIIVQWIDPTPSQAQMAGNWNNRSIEVLVQTDAGQKVSFTQCLAFIDLKLHVNEACANADLKYLGSHHEAGRSGPAGHINNVDEIRKATQLHGLPVHR